MRNSRCASRRGRDQDSLTMMIFDQGYKKATVKKAGNRYLVHTNEIGHFSEELNPFTAKAFLMVKWCQECYRPVRSRAAGVGYALSSMTLLMANVSFRPPELPISVAIFNSSGLPGTMIMGGLLTGPTTSSEAQFRCILLASFLRPQINGNSRNRVGTTVSNIPSSNQEISWLAV